jgi:hypothetical protein
VVQVFQWIGQEGRSTFWASNELNRLGIKPHYAEKWVPALVGFICKNRAYTGNHAYNKAWYITNPERPLMDITAEMKRTIRRPKPEDDWAHFDVPALVSEKLWSQANQNIRERGMGRGKAGKTIQALFRGRVYCPECGNIMRLYRDSKCSWLTYYVCRAEKCKMKFIRVSQLDKDAWEAIVKMLQDSDLVERQLKGEIKEDDGIKKRIRLELFHKREAERKISDIQDDFFASPPLITREEAAEKINRLRASVAKADAEIARLQNMAQVAKQSQETVVAAKKALEALRDLNLKTANFQQQSELVARMGVKIYPDEDLTYIRIYSVLNIEEPRKVSCQMTSIASPKL